MTGRILCQGVGNGGERHSRRSPLHYFPKVRRFGTDVQAKATPDTLCRCTGVRDKNSRLIFEHDIVRREIWGEDVIGEVVWSDLGLTGFFLEATDKGQKGVSHSYPISRGGFDDDEWNVNTDEVIGNTFDCPIC